MVDRVDDAGFILHALVLISRHGRAWRETPAA